ncbi:MAG: ABC transporter permease [Microlunatus sp.]
MHRGTINELVRRAGLTHLSPALPIPTRLATVVDATAKNWLVVISPIAWGGGLAAALVIGVLAGLLPALRAARMSPTEALWTS